MHPAFARIDHRPWPVPSENWRWRQSWRDLLFAHWPVRSDWIRHLVPPALELEEFDGTSWVGVVPFRMSGVMIRPLPDLPWLSAFPEINLRLYVQKDGRPGVWFLSLDATNPVAIWAARQFFYLPYFRAGICLTVTANQFYYRSTRTDNSAIQFAGTYGPTSEVYEAKPGTLEHFLTERYCVYAVSPNGTLYRTDVHHVPWPLQRAEAEIEVNILHHVHQFDIPSTVPLLHFARRIDVAVWSPRPIAV